MASPAGSFAVGLERGWRMGDSAEQAKFRREDRARDQKDRDREDRINAIVGQAFAEPGAAPAATPAAMPEPTGLGAVPGAKPAAMPAAPAMQAVPGARPAEMPGLQSQPARREQPDLVGQLNGTLSRLFKAASDPANADIAPHLFDKANVIAGSAKRFGDVMLQQARQKAMPHIQALYNPGATDEQKTAAVSALMNDVFPDGDTYQPKVVGKEVHLLDAAGKPVMGPDGKPRVLSMDEVDEMLTYGLSTPDDYIASVQESIKARREQTIADAKLAEQRAYDERRDEEKYKRDRGDKLEDRAYTAGLADAKDEREAARALEKEGREDRRATIKAKRDFIAKAMAAYDKDAASGMADPKGRAQYLAQIRATADEQFGGGESRPSKPTGPRPGEAIDVDMDAGLGGGTKQAGIDRSRPIINNADGSFSTERTITIEADGRHLVIPTIVGGQQMSEQQAIEAWRSGKNPPVIEAATADEADRLARARSSQIGVERGAEAGLPPVPMPGEAAAPAGGPSGASYTPPEIGTGYGEMVAGATDAIEGLEGWKDRQRTSGFRSMAEKFRQGVAAGKVDPALSQRLRSVPDRVLARDYGLSPKEIAVLKQGG